MRLFGQTLCLCLLLSVAVLSTADVKTADVIHNPELQLGINKLKQSSKKKLKAAVLHIGTLRDTAALPILAALRQKRLYFSADGQPYIQRSTGESYYQALTAITASIPTDELVLVKTNNLVRRSINNVMALLSLQAADRETREQAIEQLSKRMNPNIRGALEAARAKESDAELKTALTLILAKLELSSGDEAQKIQAITDIQQSARLQFKTLLEPMVQADSGESAKVVQAARLALQAIEKQQAFINAVGNTFYGISLGSILLLAALGLAITFGLMGVINMAHGEMIMIGAYTTYVVQLFFQQYLPGLFDLYIIVAIPAAFMVSGSLGMLLERTVIRFLYGRPLETLLATWGISLLLIQTVRLQFGAQNVALRNPEFLSGGVTVLDGLVLPYSRLAIIFFAIFVVAFVWILLQRTSLGLQVRAVTSNRNMSACMGIKTGRVDMWTFGLGSGVAGLGGVALSQIGNVGPELGQSYIVDSFMVVVLGGVGKLAGTVVGAFGLGIINKMLEPAVGAVLGKILVLAGIILFIQKRPQGIFALKGRTAEH